MHQAIFYPPPIENSHIADILQEIYLNRIYHPFLAGKKNLVIADIGANIGLFSQYAANFGVVHAFEPAKEAMNSMIEMVNYNKLSDKIKMYNVAISNTDGEATLFHAGNPTANSLNVLVNSEGTNETVRTWTIKTMFDKCKLDKIDLCKLDIEGHEFSVLSSSEFKDYAQKIDTIVGEYHQWTNINPIQLINMLRDYGYKADWTNATQATTFYATRL